MKPDDELCLCFHVTKRKVANFIRLEKPRRAAQLSECYGAGTGCGWCRPYLERMFEASQTQTGDANLPTAEQYAQDRGEYVRQGKGTPPPGATQIEDKERMPQPIWNQPPAGRTIAVVGDVYRFLATGADTGGQFALWEAIVSPGAGPPPHIHTREVESFYVLEGEVTFTLESGKRVAGPGTFVGIPIGILHSFGNDTDKPARMLIQVAPAGLEEMFFRCGLELPEGTTTCDPPTPEEIKTLLKLAPQYGVDIKLPENH